MRKSQQSEEEKEQKGEEKENEKEEARPYDRVHDFVLEVGMGDKTPELSALADSYIQRGTLCVMTVKVERHGESDFAWSCFVPSSVLKKNGVTRKEDQKAVMTLSMSLEKLGETEARLDEFWERGESMSQHLEKLEKLL